MLVGVRGFVPMTDYRQLMRLVLQKVPYRQIVARQGCSQRTIAKVRRVLDERGLTEVSQVEALSDEEIAVFFIDGRKSVVEGFVPIDVEAVVAARMGRKKPPLKVLWARYLQAGGSPGARFYGYDRFCEIVAIHVRTNDLTAPINHVPGHTMQVDWAGMKMTLTDPITGEVTAVSVFVASLPYSGLVFAHGYTDEKFEAWADGHIRAFEYFGGVPLLVVPDNASTASNRISKADRAREVNSSYSQFLEHYQTAAVPTRSAAPRDKGNVEAVVKVVTNWIIHYLAERMFASLEDLNEAVGERVEWVNNRIPFRGNDRPRSVWFAQEEVTELMALPAQRWVPVTWRRAKVHRDWHIQLDSIKYSVPYALVGTDVDVRIIGTQLDILAGGAIVATHTRASQRGAYVTDPGHGPVYYEQFQGLWSRAYFLRQGAKVGPATTAAVTRLLDAKKIEAQGFRSCMNILDLGKRGGKQVLEAACARLVADERRPISYTAVKHAMTAIRAERNARPTTWTNQVGSAPPGGPVQDRDTTGAHLAGPSAFTLEAILGDGTQGGDDNDA